MSGPSAESGGELRSGLPPDGIVAFIRARLDWRLECIERGATSTEAPRAEWEQWDWVRDGRREVEALRRIVDRHLRVPRYEYADTLEPYDFMCLTDDDDWPCLEVRDLASIWRDHPAWDPAWAPEEART